ncbi:hypothetical protein [Polynucleobacter sp.]
MKTKKEILEQIEKLEKTNYESKEHELVSIAIISVLEWVLKDD